MGNSDSDSENECFESAEESLDEEEEEKSVKRKSKKSESEVIESVSNCENVDVTQKDISGNLSYRKRPERVKRSLSNTGTKPISKSPSNESVFKTDKIVPDAFFQDITSNLSKNINKSLNTLHQKSSNVKDLILSSLPVSSFNENERFSYDDTLQTTGESDLPNPENFENSESSNFLNKEEDNAKSQPHSYEEQKPSLETDISTLGRNTDNSSEGKPPDGKSGTLDTNTVGDFNSQDPTLINEIDDDISKKSNVQVCSGDAINVIPEDSSEEEVKIKTESEITQDNKTSTCTSELVCENEKPCSNKISETKAINSSCSEQANVEAEVCNSESIECTERKIETQDHTVADTVSDLQQESQTDLVDDNVNHSEIVKNKENEEKNLEKNQVLEDFTKIRDPKIDVTPKCNLEELKTALENIVKIEESNLESHNEDKQSTEEDICNEEKIENVEPNEGWDDFDFSDNEIENIHTGEPPTSTTNATAPIESKVVTEQKPTVSENKTTKTSTNSTSSNKKFSKNEHTTTNQSQQSTKSETPPEDNWDWDNWDETPDDNKKDSSISKPKTQQTNEGTSDISKWSGWDTFAQKPQEKQGNWGLGSWGVDVLLNKATAVTQGISNVLEAGLGAPDPETLARMDEMKREKQNETETEEEIQSEIQKKNSLTNVNLFPVSGITSLVAGVTSKIVEHSKIQEIGSKVITGGLDTLETFGKKTMEVLQDGDPGLKNKRALLMGNSKPVLSQVLKEAREKADREMKKVEEKELARKCHFETLFDDFQGMVHLEALEMLSRQCELKLEQIRSGMNSEEQEDLNGILEEVEQLCALDEFESDFKSSVVDFKTALQMAVEPLKDEISVYKIVQVHEGVNKWLEMSSETKQSLAVVNQKLVSTVAELAAATVQQFHKSGELLSVKECRKTVGEVDALSRLTNILCSEINRICDKFMLLSRSSSVNRGDENLNSFSEKVTNVKQNSTSYIRQAFDLLIPVLQLGAAV